MSEFKPISPLLDGMELIRPLADSGASRLYLLRHTVGGESFILKQIGIPESQTQVEALLITGAAANEEEAARYYEQRVADYVDSVKALAPLRGSSNCAVYLDYQVCAREEGVGFELSLLSERYTTLPEYLDENAMTHLRALNLGLDLCTALCELRGQGLIHRDVKPENIYLNHLGGFMIGDLGAARISQLKFCAMPDRMISAYTAPEIADALGDFNTTVDIYSVGMVLYRILNGNHGPFEDENTSAAAANKLRLAGEPLPTPLYADYELAEIVLKACAFDPAERYQAPDEMLQELVLYMKRNNVTDTLIVPPIIAGEDMLVSPDSMDEPVEPVRFAQVEAMDEKFVDSFSPTMEIPDDDVHEEDDSEDELDEIVEMFRGAEDGGGPTVFAAPHTRHVSDEDDAPPADGKESKVPPAKPPKAQKAGAARKGGKKKKGLIWVPIVIAVLLLGVMAVAGWYLLLGGPAAAIGGITVTDRGVDWLEVDVDDGGKGLGLVLVCTGTNGTSVRQDWSGEPVAIKGLEPGTQYTISAASRDGQKRLSGQTSISAATVAATEIVEFTVSPAGNGQASLKLTVSGPDPGEWTARYTAEGVEAQEISFSGGSATIFNLEPDTRYTFTLLEPEGAALRGATVAELTTEPNIQIVDLKAEAVSGSSARAAWTCEGDEPAEWSVTCTGPDGTSKTQFVAGCAAEFTQLTSGETYTISVTAPGVSSPAETTVVPLAAEVQSIQASVLGADGLRVVWESDQPAASWLLRYAPKGSEDAETVQVDGSEAVLTGLVPGVTYEVELRSSRDEPLGDAAKTEASLPAAEKFKDYGAERFFMGTFALPERAGWTRMDLNPGVSSFAPGKGLAFAVDSFTGHDKSGDEIKVSIVVEDSKGVPRVVKNYTDTWDGLWKSGVIVGFVDALPSDPGDYVVRLFFNNKLAVSKGITVLSE